MNPKAIITKSWLRSSNDTEKKMIRPCYRIHIDTFVVLPRPAGRRPSERWGTWRSHCQSHTGRMSRCPPSKCFQPIGWHPVQLWSHISSIQALKPLSTLKMLVIPFPQRYRCWHVPSLTFKSRWIIGVWQWWSRDTASHTSQNIRSTSGSVNPTPRRSFIWAMTEAVIGQNTFSPGLQLTTLSLLK